MQPDEHVLRVFRYVDDFLIILKLAPGDSLPLIVSHVLKVFCDCAGALNFTHELPNDNAIRF